MNIEEIMLEISHCFEIEEEVVSDRLYHSVEELNFAFSDNVVWEDNCRRKNLGIILYSLGKYISIMTIKWGLANIDLEMQLVNFELLLLSVMPEEWRFHIQYKKERIESYFYSFTQKQSNSIELFFSYIVNIGIFPYLHDELIEVVNFWNSMSSDANMHPEPK